MTYYQEHRERIIEKHKEKINCPCGVVVAYGNLSSHRKSSRHLIFLQATKSVSLVSIPQASSVETPSPR